jgi:repressor LexA
MALTPKQKLVLDFITISTRKRGYAPSQVEIARHFKFKSLGTVQDYLVRLEKDGFLKREWNQKRSLVTTAPAQAPETDTLTLPLLGQVAAGRPIEAVERQDEIEVPRSLVKRGEHFVLRVVGQSMVDDGIFDGDLIVVKRQRTAENGQTVVALVDDAATVKRFYRRANNVELHPSNSAFKPIIVNDSQDFRIEGVLSGLIRSFK